MSGKRNGLHSCKSFEHYTPVEYIEAARYVLGRIDLDPASCARANETVRASTYYTKEDDGLTQTWFGNVYLNPPNNQRGYLIKAFWRRACEHVLFDGGTVLWAGYSLGPLARLHACEPLGDGMECPGPISWPIVMIGPQGPGTTPGGRICWIDGETGEAGKQPGHGNYFCLLGGDAGQRERFRDRFGEFGDYCEPKQHMGSLASDILCALRRHGPMSKRAIARVIHARKVAVARVVDQLASAQRIRRACGWTWAVVGTQPTAREEGP